jgi:nucleoside-diphosphate kinase
MAAQNDDSLLFVVEWYDPMPQLKRKYLLKFFTDQRMVEMIDVKTKKIFLKKSPCPSDISKEDFYIGGKVLMYSRELDIIDYGDLKTKDKLQFQTQQCMIILPASSYRNWGIIVHELTQKFNLSKLKTVFLSSGIADTVCKLLEISPRKSSLFSEGVCLAIVVNSEDGFNKLNEWANGIRAQFKDSDSINVTSNGIQTSDLFDLLFDNQKVPTTATLDNCTCCIVKPHAVKAKQLGSILDLVISQGYEVSCLRSLQFDRAQAEEFLEVYKGVVPEYADQVLQLSSGISVAMEIRAQGAVETFRQTAGPWDVELAKELRPDTIRGKFGLDRVRSAVHCTDLASDGVLECEYCFRLL